MSRESSSSQEPVYESYYTNGNLARYQLLGYNSKSVTRSRLVKNKKDLSGWRSPSAYQCTVNEESPLQGSVTVVRYQTGKVGPILTEMTVGHLWSLYGNMPAFTSKDTGAASSNDKYRAEVECLLKVRSMSVNLLQVFAERQKTIDLISERTTRLFRAYGLAKRGKYRDAAKMLGVDKGGKKTAGSWLELQYGWLPLLSDIHGGYEHLTGRRASKGMLFNASRTVTSSDNRVDQTTAADVNKITNVQSEKITKVSLWYTVEYPALLEASKLGLLNPLEVAWELVPWSFVIDWFLPIGNVLGALSATSGCKFKGGTCTTVVKADMQCMAIPKSGPVVGGSRERSGRGVGTRKLFKMNRTVYSASPIPVLYVKNPLSVGHALNAVALIRGFFK